MIRQLGIVALAGLALGCSTGSAIGGSDDRATASLQVVKRAPLTLMGRSFQPGERVRLTVGRQTKGARANQSGTFVVTLGGPDRCSTTRVLAIGSEGSNAIVKVLPSPECPPAQ